MKSREVGRLARIPRIAWLFLALAALVLLTTAGQILALYVDWFWFREVRFTSVFFRVIEAEALVGLVAGAAFFAILYGNLTLARRLAPRDVLVLLHDVEGLPSPEIVDGYLRRLTLPISVIIALFAGWVGAGSWELVLKALYPTPFGVRDRLVCADPCGRGAEARGRAVEAAAGTRAGAGIRRVLEPLLRGAAVSLGSRFMCSHGSTVCRGSAVLIAPPRCRAVTRASYRGIRHGLRPRTRSD